MKKYLISIEQTDSPRLNQFFAQSTFLDTQSEFKTFGVIGKDLTVSEYFSQGVAGKNKAMTPGELGCCLSHLAALKDFLASKDDYAIIFEDDAIQRFEIDLDELEKEVCALHLTPGVFLSLGGIQMKICRKLRGKYLTNTLCSKPLLKVDPYYYENLSYAYAYIVDRAMAEALLVFHETPKIYDQWAELSVNSNVQFYVSYLFGHPEIDSQASMSYLESERENMKNKSKDHVGINILYLVKKIKSIFLQLYKID